MPSWKRPPRWWLDGRPGSPHPSLAGAVAAPQLLPSPLGLLTTADEGPPKISCFAPLSYTGSTFELFAVGADVPAQSIAAEPDQHKVDFTLGGATPASRCYRCRYRSYNGSAWQTSAFSMEIVVNGAGGGMPAGGGAPSLPGRGCSGQAVPGTLPTQTRRVSPQLRATPAAIPPPPPRPAAPCPPPPPCGKVPARGTRPARRQRRWLVPGDPLRPRRGFPCR